MAKHFAYATIKRGTVKVTSRKQLALLNARHLPYTAVYKTSGGKTVRQRKNT